MTNTDTADADATALQVARLAQAGSQLVRVTVNNEAAAAAVPEMIRKVRGLGFDVPIVGDFHYNGHLLLVEVPGDGRARWPSTGSTRATSGRSATTSNFQTIVRVAIEHDKPVRIGVNWGSLDQALLTELMEANARLGGAARRPRRDDRGDARVGAALGRAGRGDRAAVTTGSSCRAKVSGVARPRRRLPAPRRALRLPAPPRADRGRDGDEGDRRLDRRPRHPAERGDRRHDPGLADPRARRRARARGRGRPAGPPVARACARSCPRSAPARAAAGRPRPSSRRWPATSSSYLKDRMPEWRDDPPRRRGAPGRGHGLRRERAGREQARRHRDQPARHVRGAGRAGLRRRQARPTRFRGDDIVERFVAILEELRRRGRCPAVAVPADAAIRPG